MAAATDGGGVGGDRRRSGRGSLALPPSSISSNRPSAPEQQGRAFVALAHVVADAGGGGWPEQHEARVARLAGRRRSATHGRRNGAGISADRRSARSAERRSDRRHAAGKRAARVSRRKVMF